MKKASTKTSLPRSAGPSHLRLVLYFGDPTSTQLLEGAESEPLETVTPGSLHSRGVLAGPT